MRYIDNGAGNRAEVALLPLLQGLLTTDVVGLRWQSGYFDARVLGVFGSALQRLAQEDLNTAVLVGSNKRQTSAPSIHLLTHLLALPRSNAHLGVVSYADGLYHPKTVHLSYSSGREVAYVGSANLTSPGLNGLNIEAGIVLDTDEGDSARVLRDIRCTIDEWFRTCPDGLFQVKEREDVGQLEEKGILATEATEPQPNRPRNGADVDLSRRHARHVLPAAPTPGTDQDDRVEATPSAEYPVAGEVLIAELTGPKRWTQSAFPRWCIQEFFQVGDNDTLVLWPVRQRSGTGAREQAVCIFKKNSVNWCFELGLAVERGRYPSPKPIGVFHRIAPQTFRYTILFPEDEAYSHVARCLGKHAPPRGNQLPRAVLPTTVLRDAWPQEWFFGT